jgi:hypothetical protein
MKNRLLVPLHLPQSKGRTFPALRQSTNFHSFFLSPSDAYCCAASSVQQIEHELKLPLFLLSFNWTQDAFFPSFISLVLHMLKGIVNHWGFLRAKGPYQLAIPAINYCNILLAP